MPYTQTMKHNHSPNNSQDTTPSPSQPWTLTGSNNQPIYGDTHTPLGKPRGVAIISHGFHSYKDYGFLPALAQYLASLNLITHRFNFSHSGMTNNIKTFEHPELFMQNTWNKQVADLHIVANAAASGELQPFSGPALPQLWLGHSRGGVTTLLATGRAFTQRLPITPAGIVTLAAGDECCSLTEDQRKEMHDEGYLNAPSNRTGQRLRVGEIWLTEQEQDPDGHNLQGHVKQIRCPMLVVHGQADDTVPHDAAVCIQQAAGDYATLISMPDTSHTFNAPNPLPTDAPLPEKTNDMFNHVGRFVDELF